MYRYLRSLVVVVNNNASSSSSLLLLLFIGVHLLLSHQQFRSVVSSFVVYNQPAQRILATTCTTDRLSVLLLLLLQKQRLLKRHPNHLTILHASTNTDDNIIPKNVKLLILPGFGNIMEDYILSSNPNDPYNISSSTSFRTGSLLQSFLNRNTGYWKYNENIFILPILQRYEWLKVFLYGLLDIQFLIYSNAPPTNPAFSWYLKSIQTTIHEQMLQTTESNTGSDDISTTTPTEIILIGHSAGGWLGRAAIAYLLDNLKPNDNYIIRGLVTLGTPHIPPPLNVMDMTRGALRYTNDNYPGAYQHYMNRYTRSSSSSSLLDNTMIETNNHNDTSLNSNNNTIFYITVCGESVQGSKLQVVEESSTTTSNNNNRQRQQQQQQQQIARFAYDSYLAVCGNGTMMGDGVVPLCSAHLDDCIQLTLPNIYHSINIPTQWYGTDIDIAFDIWYNTMMEQINKR